MLHVGCYHVHTWLFAALAYPALASLLCDTRITWPLLRSTAISLSCRMLRCDSIFNNLISRRAVIGNYITGDQHTFMLCLIKWPDSVFLIVHENLFERNERSIFFGTGLVDLPVKDLMLKDHSITAWDTNPKVPSPSFPRNSKSRILVQPRNLGLPQPFRSRDAIAIPYGDWVFRSS